MVGLSPYRSSDGSAPLLVAVLLACGALAATGALAESQTPWQSWKRLSLKAKAVPLFSGRVELRLDRRAGKTVFRTRTIARFIGARIAASETRTVLDAETGRTELYVSRTRKRARRYTFGEREYSVEKLRPDLGADEPLDRWTVVQKQSHSYPVDDNGKTTPVHDYYGMLLRLRDVELEQPGDEVVLHVATSKGPAPYRIRVTDARTSDWSYRNPALGARRTLPVRELRLRISPADPERADEGFLKMEGETELWVEAGSRTPLSLSGKIPKIPGRVRLVLTELE